MARFALAALVLIPLAMSSCGNKRGHNLDMSVCANNIKQIGMVLREYVNQGGAYPPLCPQSGVLMFSPQAMPQKDKLGPLLTCPTIRNAKGPTTGPASPFDDQSYFYLGYAVLDDDDVEAFAQAYRKQIAGGGTFDADLVAESSQGKHVFHRLAEGVENVVRTEGAIPANEVPAVVVNKIPVLIERDLGHIDADSDGRPGGAWVLFLSGEARFVERGQWPITEKTQRILAELAK